MTREFGYALRQHVPHRCRHESLHTPIVSETVVPRHMCTAPKPRVAEDTCDRTILRTRVGRSMFGSRLDDRHGCRDADTGSASGTRTSRPCARQHNPRNPEARIDGHPSIRCNSARTSSMGRERLVLRNQDRSNCQFSQESPAIAECDRIDTAASRAVRTVAERRSSLSQRRSSNRTLLRCTPQK